MNIVTPYARIHAIDGADPTPEAGISALRRVEWIGRISHRSEDAQTPDSWQRFIKAVVVEHGDWSIVEHVNVTVDFLVDRGITHELVRHRLCAFTQQSTRFVNHAKKIPPEFIDPLDPVSSNQVTQQVWRLAIEHAELSYMRLIEAGCTPQIARSVFPNALASRIVVTSNLRNWRHLLTMRSTKETHPQFREVSIPLLAEFKRLIPLLYDDIEPMAKQSEGMKRAR